MPNPDEIIRSHIGFEPSGVGWKGVSELPTAAELLREQGYIKGLPANPVKGGWASKEAYLEAQYKILRCNGIEGLRYSIASYRKDDKMKDDENTCVYVSAHVSGYYMTRLGPFCRIAFSTRRAGKKIRWKQSKRLTPGTLVAISTAEDKFQTICKVGVVAQRLYYGGLDQNPPEIDITWANIDEAVIDPDDELVMLESRNSYFEAVRYALIGLQHAARTPSSLDKYLVSCDKSDSPAEFVKNSAPSWNLSSIVHRVPRHEARDQPVDLSMLSRLRASVGEHNILSGMPDVAESTTLDASQISALHRMVTKELAVIQGPPGTGKTFTSVSALRVMIDNRQRGDPPIIVAAQTNHALDQILLLCEVAGAKVLRVGGRTANERMKKRTAYALRQKCKHMVDGNLKKLDRELTDSVKTLKGLIDGLFTDDVLKPEKLRDAGIITEAQCFSLIDDSEWETTDKPPMAVWLGDQRVRTAYQKQWEFQFREVESNEEYEAEQEFDPELDKVGADEDEDDRIQGDFISFDQVWTGKIPDVGHWRQRCEELLDKEQDLWDISGLRGGVYHVMLSKYRQIQADAIRAVLKEATLRAQKVKARKWAKDLGIVPQQAISIVGCTTTGLTKYRGFLAAMQPRTMLVEEAAETREANVVSALYPSIQQLILVGDHQQLTAHCEIRQLEGSPFNLEVSLFERLVKNGVPYEMLNQQRRMAPEISYIVGKFYPELQDHPLVTDSQQRPLVPGMGDRRSFFFTHNWPEETDVDGSKSNQMEADMIVAFVGYLVNNGMKLEHITILTYYNGQRKLLVKELKRRGFAGETGYVNVFTVDSYQGEENDIVILSLVRSPQHGKHFAIGFLSSQNRATVAVSRARRGFFMFGNKDNLLNANLRSEQSFRVWANIWNGFAEQGRVAMGKGLPLVCQNHSTEIWCQNPDDFIGNAGGCSVKCDGTLPCGHPCELKCHPMEHSKLPCLKPCTRILPCGHKCRGSCTDECSCTCTDSRARAQQGGNTTDDRTGNTPAATSGTSTPATPGNRHQPRRGAIRGAHRGRGGRGGQQFVIGTTPRGNRGGNTGRSPSFNPRNNLVSQSPQTQALAQGHSQPGNNAGWHEFTRNISHHDEQALQTAMAQQDASPGTKVPGNNHNIHDNWKRTPVTGGRRAAAAAGASRRHQEMTSLVDVTNNLSLTNNLPLQEDSDIPSQPRREISEPPLPQQGLMGRTMSPPARADRETLERFGYGAEVFASMPARVEPAAQPFLSSSDGAVEKEEDGGNWLIDFD